MDVSRFKTKNEQNTLVIRQFSDWKSSSRKQLATFIISGNKIAEGKM